MNVTKIKDLFLVYAHLHRYFCMSIYQTKTSVYMQLAYASSTKSLRREPPMSFLSTMYFNLNLGVRIFVRLLVSFFILFNKGAIIF